MSEPEATPTTEATAEAPLPTGWTGEQLSASSPALTDCVVRAVRAAEADGWRLRCGSVPRQPNSIALVVLNEHGVPSSMKHQDGSHTALCEAVAQHLVTHGLKVGSIGDVAIAVSVAAPAEAEQAAQDVGSDGRRRAGTKR